MFIPTKTTKDSWPLRRLTKCYVVYNVGSNVKPDKSREI